MKYRWTVVKLLKAPGYNFLSRIVTWDSDLAMEFHGRSGTRVPFRCNLAPDGAFASLFLHTNGNGIRDLRRQSAPGACGVPPTAWDNLRKAGQIFITLRTHNLTIFWYDIPPSSGPDGKTAADTSYEALAHPSDWAVPVTLWIWYSANLFANKIYTFCRLSKDINYATFSKDLLHPFTQLMISLCSLARHESTYFSLRYFLDKHPL